VTSPVIGVDDLVVNGKIVWRFRCRRDHFQGRGEPIRERCPDPTTT
jgi:hypothetical protein